MELKVGMYVRTEHGEFTKIESFYIRHEEAQEYVISFSNGGSWRGYLEDLKASHNIIDLIEEHDILLLFAKEYDEKYKAEVILDSEDFKSIVDYEQTNLLNLEYELITEEHIKLLSIVTKEQFESIKYSLEG